MNTAFVKQVRTGKVKQIDHVATNTQTNLSWKTAIYKEVQEGPVLLTEKGLQGDFVAKLDLTADHDCALFAYPAHHYEFWLENLQLAKMEEGILGENLVLEGMDEFTTFIGDTYRLGEAIVQVSQPYEPNWHQSQRIEVYDFALRMQEEGRTGWYYRVLEEGFVEAGMELQLIDRLHPEWSIAAVNEVIYVKKANLRLAYDLSQCAMLSSNWRQMFADRLKGRRQSFNERLFGKDID